MLPTSIGSAVQGLLAAASDAAVQNATLWVNHLVASEPAAVARLRPHAGRRLRLSLGEALPWRRDLEFCITPAGLFETAFEVGSPGPCLTVRLDGDPVSAARRWLAGERARWIVEGDAELAVEIDWLVKNLRWDLQDDLGPWVGPVVAHQIARAGGLLSAGVRGAAQRATGLAGDSRKRPAAP